jgi:FtsP/CotA-like multicopper oxidase with cupredoxin domain
MRIKNNIFGVLAVAILCCNTGYCKNVKHTLYINKGLMKTVNNYAQLPYIAFNFTPKFASANAHMVLTVGDSLLLTIKNTDSQAHAFTVQNTAVANIAVPAQDSVKIKLKMNQMGTYIFYDPTEYPKNRYLGLAGLIAVDTKPTYKSYYWNFKEHDATFNNQLDKNVAVNWDTYYPSFFTCNSLSYPDSGKDTTANILGNVGDTIHIFMANTGQAQHAIHFHGFHSKIIQTNKYKKYIGFSKDSFPLESMQTMVLELVLDKAGAYPVHDHNLLAMTGNKMHPYGMMLIINVK